MVSADSVVKRLHLSGKYVLFSQWLAASGPADEAATSVEQPVQGLPVDPNDVSALDAVKIGCNVQGPLELLMPPKALAAMSGDSYFPYLVITLL